MSGKYYTWGWEHKVSKMLSLPSKGSFLGKTDMQANYRKNRVISAAGMQAEHECKKRNSEIRSAQVGQGQPHGRDSQECS